ncbi:MAG: hypothetical protein AAFW87_12040 [Pseudomonadota bacterium]
MTRFSTVFTLVCGIWAAGSASAESGVVMQFDPANASRFEDMFPRSGKGLTNKKTTVSGNNIDIVSDPQLSRRVIALSAKRRKGNTVSKSSVVHEGFSAKEGSTLVVSMDVKLNTLSPGGIFMMDIECSDCWPKPSIHPNKSPGIRLYIDKSTGSLAIDRGKIGLRSKPLRTKGRAPRFPTDKWVTLVWRSQISSGKNALTQIYVDDVLHLEARGATLMDDRVFKKYGINLRKLEYNYVEMGVTANESARDLEMRISKVEIRLE